MFYSERRENKISVNSIKASSFYTPSSSERLHVIFLRQGINIFYGLLFLNEEVQFKEKSLGEKGWSCESYVPSNRGTYLDCSNNPAHRYYLATDPVTGQLYVSDTNSRKIYRPKSLAGTKDLQSNTDVVAGTGEHCLPFDENHCGDGGKAPEASLTGPKGRGAKLMKVSTWDRRQVFQSGGLVVGLK